VFVFAIRVLLSPYVTHRRVPLKLGLNEYVGYSEPANVDYLGPPYLFFGFIPAQLTARGNKEGSLVSRL